MATIMSLLRHWDCVIHVIFLDIVLFFILLSEIPTNEFILIIFISSSSTMENENIEIWPMLQTPHKY